ncbi:porin family protein [Formosa maritima]|uniref:PorT family protein n=1 Tax=Formosa maritima TaxID=2592046 RepID=A0A5D0G1Y7_9FLAO|nr:porin family protein [Formosa maritima]TYA52329.1 PorT family protein [Formosa maritima]
MKKLFLAIAFVAISLPTFSQVKVRPGLRMGINLSNITNIDNTERKVGFNGAMFANIHFARFYELQPELTYSNQGFKRNDYAYYDPYYGDVIHMEGDNFNIHYVGMSVANKFFVVPNIGLHFIVGPSVEVNISDDSDYDEITPIDFSLFGGIGYEFKFGLSLEARYKQGFIDIRDDYFDYIDDNDYDYYDDNFLNSSFQFSVSYKFDF